jgi:hypothetical protein
MDILLLGGNSPENKQWIREVEAAVAPLFDKTLVHEYAHWASASPHIDLEHELKAVRAQVRSLGDYCLFAKSAGVVLSLKGIFEKSLHPKLCLFVGTPLAFVHAHGHQLDTWLTALNVPTIFAQNAHDPAGSYQEIDYYLRQHMRMPRYKVVELPGQTHTYPSVTVKELVQQLIGQKEA